MKQLFYILIPILILSLSGCSRFSNIISDNIEENNSGKKASDDSAHYVETLENYSFQYNEGTNDYSVFFGLCDESGKFISANVEVNIKIVNDKDEEVFNSTKTVSKDDFSYYTSKLAGEQYLANVKISASEIMSGKSSNGTVYLTVYKENILAFDEVTCSALYCLPISDVQLSAKVLPVELAIKNYDGTTGSKIRIDDISFKFSKEISPRLTITVMGAKTYGNGNNLADDTIDYKLYDSKGYLVDSGSVFLDALSKGDKFKDDSIVIYDVTPENLTKLNF